MTFLKEKLKMPVYEGKELEFQTQGFCNLVLQNERLNRLMKHNMHHGKKQGSFTQKSLDHN